MVEVVIAVETGTKTAEEDSIVDELVWTGLCTDTTEINVELETLIWVVGEKDVGEEDDGVLGAALTDEEYWVVDVADEDPPRVPEGAILRA